MLERIKWMMVVIFFLGTSGYGVAAYHFVVGYVGLVDRGDIKYRSFNYKQHQ